MTEQAAGAASERSGSVKERKVVMPNWEQTDQHTYEATAGPFQLELQECTNDTWSFWIHLGNAVVCRKHGIPTADRAKAECHTALRALCADTISDLDSLEACVVPAPA